MFILVCVHCAMNIKIVLDAMFNICVCLNVLKNSLPFVIKNIWLWEFYTIIVNFVVNYFSKFQNFICLFSVQCMFIYCKIDDRWILKLIIAAIFLMVQKFLLCIINLTFFISFLHLKQITILTVAKLIGLSGTVWFVKTMLYLNLYNLKFIFYKLCFEQNWFELVLYFLCLIVNLFIWSVFSLERLNVLWKPIMWCFFLFIYKMIVLLYSVVDRFFSVIKFSILVAQFKYFANLFSLMFIIHILSIWNFFWVFL